MGEQHIGNRREQLRTRLRQLILLRETGPKSAAWHAARMNLIWRLHDEIKLAEQREPEGLGTTQPNEDGG